MRPDLRTHPLTARSALGALTARSALGALAALLALALVPAARADEASEIDALTRLLLEPELRDDQARAHEAADVLSADRTRKLANISSAFVDFGLHATVQASPIRLLRSARDIGREVRDWNDRSAAEEEALLLLAPGARTGALGEDGLALYRRLERRESEERVAQLLADAERALGDGDLRRAQRDLDRALALEPGSARADRLLDELDRRLWLAELERGSGPESDRAAHERFASWEIELSTALLTEDFARAQELGPHRSSDAELGRATAAYLSGERDFALDAFRELAGGDGPAARSAEQTLADPGLNPVDAFDAEVSRYRTQRTLGWMGGEELASMAVPVTDEALSLTRDGYRAWQDSVRAWRRMLRPVNLLIEAPARAWRSWQPDGRALHGAAERYLGSVPHGERAEEAAGWLEALGEQTLQRPNVAPFRDGMLVLPHARTPFGRLSETCVLVARAALESAVPELFARLSAESSAPAFELALDSEPRDDLLPELLLSEQESIAALSRLAADVEDAALAPSGIEQGGLLALLRRLDTRVRAGGVLVARAWLDESTSGLDAVGAALIDSKRTRTGAFAIQRQRETFVAERGLAGSSSFCPEGASCIDAQRESDPIFYATSDVDGEVGIGARAGFQDARLSLEIGTSGPSASFVLPLARWLGFAHFVPLDARVGVSLEGITAGPGHDDEEAERD